jgi:anti-anti-sigma regulatory factor
MTVTTTVRQDEAVICASLSGSLSMADVVDVRVSLLKCLAEQPLALIVDLDDLIVAEPLALAVLLAVARQAGRWPGTPVLLAASDPHTTTLLGTAAYRRIPVFSGVPEAREHALRESPSPPTVSDELLPLAGAARHGRNMVTDACLRWELDDLIAPGALIISELIGNVLDHANTMMTVRLSVRNRYFFIAVRDGSTVEPPQSVHLPDSSSPGGRGLFLVNATAHSWGSLPALGGKVVWASLATNRLFRG